MNRYISALLQARDAFLMLRKTFVALHILQIKRGGLAPYSNVARYVEKHIQGW